MDRNIEDQITIDQGVYGLLISGCGDGGCTMRPAANEVVTVYAAGESGAFATMPSDGEGVYQIVLPNGDYTLCTSACVPISTPASDLVRYDWTSGPGGGSWQKI